MCHLEFTWIYFFISYYSFFYRVLHFYIRTTYFLELIFQVPIYRDMSLAWVKKFIQVYVLLFLFCINNLEHFVFLPFLFHRTIQKCNAYSNWVCFILYQKKRSFTFSSSFLLLSNKLQKSDNVPKFLLSFFFFLTLNLT